MTPLPIYAFGAVAVLTGIAIATEGHATLDGCERAPVATLATGSAWQPPTYLQELEKQDAGDLRDAVEDLRDALHDAATDEDAGPPESED